MTAVDATKHDKAKSRMLAEIEREARDTESWTGRAAYAERVMNAIRKVPRHEFVPEDDAAYAYVNRPRSIGHGQTISQPYIVALMSELLDLQPGDRVLEIGTGCGYQAAVLAELAGEVASVETVGALAKGAAERLRRLGYRNVEVRHGDGFKGWPEKAPFDAIIVTAAPEHIPEALARQLKPGGRLVIPVGRPHDTQMLYRCVKGADGALACEKMLPVAFVPMVERREDERKSLL
jgi:protein-L-isoaspartate(D-aspartate) O-methyltransferase